MPKPSNAASPTASSNVFAVRTSHGSCFSTTVSFFASFTDAASVSHRFLSTASESRSTFSVCVSRCVSLQCQASVRFTLPCSSTTVATESLT